MLTLTLLRVYFGQVSRVFLYLLKRYDWSTRAPWLTPFTVHNLDVSINQLRSPKSSKTTETKGPADRNHYHQCGLSEFLCLCRTAIIFDILFDSAGGGCNFQSVFGKSCITLWKVTLPYLLFWEEFPYIKISILTKPLQFLVASHLSRWLWPEGWQTSPLHKNPCQQKTLFHCRL